MGLYKNAFNKQAQNFFSDFGRNPGATAAGGLAGAGIGFGTGQLAKTNKGTTAILTLLGLLTGGLVGGKLGGYLNPTNWEKTKGTLGELFSSDGAKKMGNRLLAGEPIVDSDQLEKLNNIGQSVAGTAQNVNKSFRATGNALQDAITPAYNQARSFLRDLTGSKAKAGK